MGSPETRCRVRRGERVIVDLKRLSVADAAAGIAAGKITSVALVQAYLDRVLSREAEIGAWAFIEGVPALDQARALDNEPPRGPLHGIPVGIKDIFDTCDMPTKYGSVIFKRHRPSADAAAVSMLRAAGAVIMGKTITAEFALGYPGRTANPHNLAHTPGGSSSGSAAAVADDMVPLALGTQTLGSVIRPASFCGVVGYKPTFGTISRAGVKPLSDELDTVGVFARTIADAALLVGVLGDRPLPDFSKGAGVSPRIGLCRTPLWSGADKATQDALEGAMSKLAAKGARVSEIELPTPCDGLAGAASVICEYDTYRSLSFERLTALKNLSAELAERLARAAGIERPTYEAALTLVSTCRRMVDGLFRDVDVLLTPAAVGEAPDGLHSTGDPFVNKLWTALHVPAVTIPVFTGPTGLPIGAQIVGARNGDGRMLVTAEWIRRALS